MHEADDCKSTWSYQVVSKELQKDPDAVKRQDTYKFLGSLRTHHAFYGNALLRQIDFDSLSTVVPALPVYSELTTTSLPNGGQTWHRRCQGPDTIDVAFSTLSDRPKAHRLFYFVSLRMRT
jgi:hypothetical protein